MENLSVFCIAASEPQSVNIVQALKSTGFEEKAISILFPDQSGTKDLAHERHSKAPEGAVAGAGTGGVVGGTLGFLAGIGTLTLPGLGALFVAGPLFAALSGVAVGATLGGIAGGLVGMGVPEYEAKRYEGKVREGNILISVHVEDDTQKEKALNIFKESEAHDISVVKEVPV